MPGDRNTLHPMATRGVLYSVVCGAGPAERVDRLIVAAQARGWSVQLFATANACRYFLDLPALERLLGRPVRTSYTEGGAQRPSADAVIVAPATYNTINKWAA